MRFTQLIFSALNILTDIEAVNIEKRYGQFLKEGARFHANILSSNLFIHFILYYFIFFNVDFCNFTMT